MENWRKVWREGVAPLLSAAGLEALRRALVTDDGRLLQGATTTPPPLPCVAARSSPPFRNTRTSDVSSFRKRRRRNGPSGPDATRSNPPSSRRTVSMVSGPLLAWTSGSRARRA